ncbi:MAG: hypothetical protein ABIF18_01685 [archaeon]
MEDFSGELRILQSIKKDCGELERRGDLTEYGYGQLALVNMISKC